MRRSVTMRARAPGEAQILKDILGLNLLNTELWRNTRGSHRDKFGNFITYGLGPNGASDLIGYRVIRVTPEMVGMRIAQFTALEVKSEVGTPTDEQRFFVEGINAAGGCAAIVRSAESAAGLLLDLPMFKKREAA